MRKEVKSLCRRRMGFLYVDSIFLFLVEYICYKNIFSLLTSLFMLQAIPPQATAYVLKGSTAQLALGATGRRVQREPSAMPRDCGTSASASSAWAGSSVTAQTSPHLVASVTLVSTARLAWTPPPPLATTPGTGASALWVTGALWEPRCPWDVTQEPTRWVGNFSCGT